MNRDSLKRGYNSAIVYYALKSAATKFFPLGVADLELTEEVTVDEDTYGFSKMKETTSELVGLKYKLSIKVPHVSLRTIENMTGMSAGTSGLSYPLSFDLTAQLSGTSLVLANTPSHFCSIRLHDGTNWVTLTEASLVSSGVNFIRTNNTCYFHADDADKYSRATYDYASATGYTNTFTSSMTFNPLKIIAIVNSRDESKSSNNSGYELMQFLNCEPTKSPIGVKYDSRKKQDMVTMEFNCNQDFDSATNFSDFMTVSVY